MFNISLLEGLLIIWALVTGALLILVIYRGTLGSQAEDQIYLSEADHLLELEHQAALKKDRKLAPFLYVLGTASGVILLSIVGIWLWRGLLMT